MRCADVRYGIGNIMNSKAGVKGTTLGKWRDHDPIDGNLLSCTLALQDKDGLIWMVCLCPRDYAVSHLSGNSDDLSILSLALFERLQKFSGFDFYLTLMNPQHL